MCSGLSRQIQHIAGFMDRPGFVQLFLALVSRMATETKAGRSTTECASAASWLNFQHPLCAACMESYGQCEPLPSKARGGLVLSMATLSDTFFCQSAGAATLLGRMGVGNKK